MKNIKPNRETCSIRVDKYILNMVREYNRKTSIPIGRFYDFAVKEKLKNIIKNDRP